MRELWRRLDAIASRTPKPLRMRPPAQERAIRAAETTIGIDFPTSFRESLLVHDGQEPGEGEDDAFEWLPGHARLASLESIVEEWKSQGKTHEKFYGDGSDPVQLIEDGKLHHWFWHPKRIPIAGNPWWDQDNTYLDFFHGPKGVPGQLVVFGKAAFGDYAGPSFGAVFELYVDALERGLFLFNGDCCVARAKRGSWPKYIRKKFG